MDNQRTLYYLNLLKTEIAPALGCTEPAAVALAVAHAAKGLDQPADSIEVHVSKYILKNGMNVGIPGTGMIGLDIAVALGALSAAPERGLMVLTGLTDEAKEEAKRMVAGGRVRIGLSDAAEKIVIDATVKAADGAACRAVITGTHTGLTLIEKDGREIFRAAPPEQHGAAEQAAPPYDVTLREILDFAEGIELESLEPLKDAVKLNTSIAQEGLTHDYGLRVGRSMAESQSLLSSDIGNYAVAMTAAAADARMAGCDKPVMSAAGSGNQGLTATVPVIAIAQKTGAGEEQLLRALAISILVTVHAKHYIGRLSVLCGCSIAAAIGSCCGILHLCGGGLHEMECGVNSMVADISGMVCDGAKPGCALKIATSVSSALRAATLAMNGIGATSYDGIVELDAEKTLENLGTLGNEGMAGTNSAILDMLLNKQCG